jgi:hypothetical protein
MQHGLMRFVMALFGWIAVLVGGGGERQATGRRRLLEWQGLSAGFVVLGSALLFHSFHAFLEFIITHNCSTPILTFISIPWMIVVHCLLSLSLSSMATIRWYMTCYVIRDRRQSERNEARDSGTQHCFRVFATLTT